MTQLRDIPFDELKIDRSFVHGAAQDNTRHAIFTASLAMAQQLGKPAGNQGFLICWPHERQGEA